MNKEAVKLSGLDRTFIIVGACAAAALLIWKVVETFSKKED